MAEKKQFQKGRMVPVPSVSIIPERDLGTTPILECSHLGRKSSRPRPRSISGRT